jgi:hypothetical protein
MDKEELVMKKFMVIMLMVALAFTSSVASADVFGGRSSKSKMMKSGTDQGIPVDPGTIIGALSQLGDYLGVREGIFYDFGTEETYNYLASTLYTYEPMNTSLSVGMLNTDGVAATIDYNIGAMIPSEGVPIAHLLEYWYVGAGLAYVKNDVKDEYQVGYGVSTQIKLTF